MRSARYLTTARSWEITTDAMPCSACRRFIRLSTCERIETSSALTGSSATITFGSSISARASAIRWRWPPENSCG